MSRLGSIMPKLSVERAVEEHTVLLAIARRLCRVAAGPIAPEAASELVGEFKVRLEDHRGREAHNLYGPLRLYARERSAEFASVLDRLLGRATLDWSTFIDRWNTDEMAANWPEFGENTRRIMNGGRARLHLEHELLLTCSPVSLHS